MPDTAAELAADLVRAIADHARVVADLEGHITREAQKQAAPMIAAAQAEANEAIRQARAETQRQEDLVGELRRRLRALDRQQQQANTVRDRLATALGYEWGPQSLTGLAAEVERRLAEDAAIPSAGCDPRNWTAATSAQMETRPPCEYPEAAGA